MDFQNRFFRNLNYLLKVWAAAEGRDLSSVAFQCLETGLREMKSKGEIPIAAMKRYDDSCEKRIALAEAQVDSIGNIDKSVRFLHNSTNNIQDGDAISSIKAYPIPTTYKLYVETSIKKASCEIYDMAGKLVLHNTFTGNTTLDLSKIKKGTYLLKIITEKGISNKKVIVE